MKNLIFILSIISLIQTKNNRFHSKSEPFKNTSILYISQNEFINKDSLLSVVNEQIRQDSIKRYYESKGKFYISKKTKQFLFKTLKSYIKKHEGLRLQPYECLGSKWRKEKFYTIGYGHVIRHNEYYLSKGITKKQAESILEKDILNAYECVSKLQGTDNLSLNRKVALTHFVYSLGIGNLISSTLYKSIKEGKDVKKEYFTVWNKIGKKSHPLLTKMRKFEYDIWTQKLNI